MSKESKFLSRVLRHEPEAAGVVLGPGGWVAVDELLRGMKAVGHAMKLDDLLRIVSENDKQRFTLSDDGRRIRAAQGHSVDVDLGLEAAVPPTELYHGTATANLDAIFAEGLMPGRRKHVHLSSDKDTALRVGQRHGKPVALLVDAAGMHAAGHGFWQADNGVWLTDTVPPAFIGFA